MTIINLISDTDKDNYKWWRVSYFIMYGFFWTIFVQIVLIIAFIVSIEYLKIEKDVTNERLLYIKNQEDTKQVVVVENQILDMVKKINELEKVSHKTLHWSRIIKEVDVLMTENMKIVTLSSQVVPIKDGDSKKNESEVIKITLNGKALYRDDLVKFEERFKKSELFFGLEGVNANYVQSRNVDFVYYFYINKDKLLD